MCPPVIRQRLPSIVLAALLLACAAYLATAAVHGWTAPSDDCNNELGECIRTRQRAAITGIALLCTGAAVWSAWVACGVLVRARVGRRQLAAVVVGAALVVTLLLADPVRHLNTSFGGWLAAVPAPGR